MSAIERNISPRTNEKEQKTKMKPYGDKIILLFYGYFRDIKYKQMIPVDLMLCCKSFYDKRLIFKYNITDDNDRKYFINTPPKAGDKIKLSNGDEGVISILKKVDGIQLMGIKLYEQLSGRSQLKVG
eukprot:226094_1